MSNSETSKEAANVQPTASTPECPKCIELQAQIQRFRTIMRRSIHAPQDANDVYELLLAE